MKYINRKCPFTGYRETVSQCETYKEALYELREYRLSDPTANYWISQRACKNWVES